MGYHLKYTLDGFSAPYVDKYAALVRDADRLFCLFEATDEPLLKAFFARPGDTGRSQSYDPFEVFSHLMKALKVLRAKKVKMSALSLGGEEEVFDVFGAQLKNMATLLEEAIAKGMGVLVAEVDEHTPEPPPLAIV